MIPRIFCSISLMVTVAIADGQRSPSPHQTDRYTTYRSGAAIEELNPLAVSTQLNFPPHLKTVQAAIDYALQRSGYSVDWHHSRDAEQIFSQLKLPEVHRQLNLMTVHEVVQTLAGEAWQVSQDVVHRLLSIELREPHLLSLTSRENRPTSVYQDSEFKSESLSGADVESEPLSVSATPMIGSLDEIVTVHRSSITVKELIELLLPEGWSVHYEVSEQVLSQSLTSHAESSRRHALLALFKEINLKALFYPRDAVVLVVEKDGSSYQRNLLSKQMRGSASGSAQPGHTMSPKQMRAQESDRVQQSQAAPLRLPLEELVKEAKTLRALMDEMDADMK